MKKHVDNVKCVVFSIRWRRVAIVACIAVMITALLLCIWGAESVTPSQPVDMASVMDPPNRVAMQPDAASSEEIVRSERQTLAQEIFAQTFIEEDTEEAFVPEMPAESLEGELYTPYVVLYDVTHEKILYSENADVRCYPASTTKLLTACVAAKMCETDTVFTVGDELSLVAWDSSLALLQRGQKLTFETLLDALMLPSGNDAAYVMAAGVGRMYAEDEDLPAEEAVAVFRDLMNQTAKRIGALDSHFVTPDGYHEEDHYTTAMDMMKIALYASSFDLVQASYGKCEAEHTFLTGETYYWQNSNPLINPASGYYYENATGMKTGFTDQAGSCLVASAEYEGVELIGVTLNGVSIDSRNNDLIKMFSTAFQYCVPS